MKPLKSDLCEIERGIAALVPPGSVVELRIPKTDHEGTVSGYFDDLAELAKQLAARNGTTAVYFVMNLVKPDLLSRAKNRVKIRVKVTTSDHDILVRIWLLIDLDPARPADISSSDQEHEAALELAREIRFALAEEGWPAPILIDSGNGAHLLYSINLPNDDRTTELIKRVLQALAERFDSDAVKIDQTVFNPSRIIKAPGTVARKGDDTPERPHRLSRILEAPSKIEPVSRELLEELAARAAVPPAEPPKSWARKFNLEEFLARHLHARAPVPYEGGRKWVLEHCPFNNDHRSPDAAIFERPNGSLGFRCLHNSCANKTWADVRAMFSARETQRANAPPKAAEPVSEALTVRDVLGLNIQPPEMLIDDVLPRRGACLMTGAQKSGKTLLSAQAAIAVASKKFLFDNYSVAASGAAMIVEQDDPSGSAAFQEIYRRAGVPKDARILFHARAPFPIGEAFIEWLEREIVKHSLVCIVLDSYTAMRPTRKPGADLVQLERSEITMLDELGKRRDCLIIVIHHESGRTKATAVLDWDARGAGTYGMTMAAEAQVSIGRYRDLPSGSNERLVRIRGRHMKDIEMVLSLDLKTLGYEHILEGGAAPLYPLLLEISKAIEGDTLRPKDLAHATGVSSATATRQITTLCNAGALQREKFGLYRFSAGLLRIRKRTDRCASGNRGS